MWGSWRFVKKLTNCEEQHKLWGTAQIVRKDTLYITTPNRWFVYSINAYWNIAYKCNVAPIAINLQDAWKVRCSRPKMFSWLWQAPEFCSSKLPNFFLNVFFEIFSNLEFFFEKWYFFKIKMYSRCLSWNGLIRTTGCLWSFLTFHQVAWLRALNSFCTISWTVGYDKI